MIKGLIPREEKFFDLFKRQAELIVECAQEFRSLLDDPKHFEARARKVKAIESQADEITHTTIELLHKTFITPMDREDIHLLISKMDDILDYLEAAAERLYLYRVPAASKEMIELAEIALQSAYVVQKTVAHLENLKDPQTIIKQCIEIHRLENEADHTLRKAMANLFDNEPDVKNLIKFKEIYELLEDVTDHAEDVANIIEGIVLEYA